MLPQCLNTSLIQNRPYFCGTRYISIQLWMCLNFYPPERPFGTQFFDVNPLQNNTSTSSYRSSVQLRICTSHCVSREKRALILFQYSSLHYMKAQKNASLVIYKDKTKVFNVIRDLIFWNTGFLLSLEIKLLCV